MNILNYPVLNNNLYGSNIRNSKNQTNFKSIKLKPFEEFSSDVVSSIHAGKGSVPQKYIDVILQSAAWKKIEKTYNVFISGYKLHYRVEKGNIFFLLRAGIPQESIIPGNNISTDNIQLKITKKSLGDKLRKILTKVNTNYRNPKEYKMCFINLDKDDTFKKFQNLTKEDIEKFIIETETEIKNRKLETKLTIKKMDEDSKPQTLKAGSKATSELPTPKRLAETPTEATALAHPDVSGINEIVSLLEAEGLTNEQAIQFTNEMAAHIEKYGDKVDYAKLREILDNYKAI